MIGEPVSVRVPPGVAWPWPANSFRGRGFAPKPPRWRVSNPATDIPASAGVIATPAVGGMLAGANTDTAAKNVEVGDSPTDQFRADLSGLASAGRAFGGIVYIINNSTFAIAVLVTSARIPALNVAALHSFGLTNTRP
jgi:hypothetical protein